MREALANRPATLADYLAILRRRKWVIATLPVMAAVSAYLVAHTQGPLYRATSQVLVSRTNIVSAISGISDPSTLGDPTRFLTTEATIGRSPELIGRVLKTARLPGVTAGELESRSAIKPQSNSDVLNVSVTWPNPDYAIRLANAYANEFTRYKTQLDTAKINDALRSLRQRIATLKAQGQTATSSYSVLLQEQSQLDTIGTLLANNTSVLQPAAGAAKVRPRPTRSALLGGLVGAVLGFGLAFLAEALDRRVRSEQELEATLGLPLLGRLPRPPRHLQEGRGLVMLAESSSVHAEAIRKLRTSIDFLNLDRTGRTIMITSAVPREGKSTTAANLAVAFARAGRRVVLVDLDLRHPSLHSFFHISVRRGIADVAIGEESLSEALRPIPLPALGRFELSKNGGRSLAADENDGRPENGAMLHVLPAGTIPPSAADFLESKVLTKLLEELATRFDLVLLDTPPLVALGDAMAVTPNADALVVVLHAGIERPLLRELARQLEHSRAQPLGFVLTGIEQERGYGYGYGYGPFPYGVPAESERSGEPV
jgi:non-specific protein-tyrosine kinase